MMREHVGMQVRLLVEALVAALEGASERLFPSMDPQMSLQVEVKRKFLAAEITLVRFFALVDG